MSDFSYFCAWWACDPVFWISSHPVILHPERAARAGGFILAPNHLSPFEVPLTVRHSPRNLDFMSIVELEKKPIARWFFGLWNTFYLDRSRPDVGTMREAVGRLKRGRVVAMFPEGNIRSMANSVLTGGPLKPGVARLAELADVPIVPCVVLGSRAYLRVSGWLPLRLTRYGVIFGNPLRVGNSSQKEQSRAQLLSDLSDTYRALAAELEAEMQKRIRGYKPLFAATPPLSGSPAGKALADQ